MQDLVVVRFPTEVTDQEAAKIKAMIMLELGNDSTVSVIVVGNGAVVDVNRAPCIWEQPVYAKRA